MVASIKNLKFMSAAVYQINGRIQHLNKQKFLSLMMSSRKRYQYDYKLIDGCFHKKLEIHVSSNSLNKQKHSAFTQTKNFIILKTPSRKRRHHDYRLIDGCFHKKVEIHVSKRLSNKQKHSAFTQTKIFLVWWRHHAIGINMIISS